MRRLGLFLALFFLICCVDHQDIINEIKIIVRPDPLKGIPDEGPFNFDEPAVGQRNYYIHFHATRASRTTNAINYEYLTDTLILAITGNETGRWILKEFLSPGSASVQNANGHFEPDSIFVTYLLVDSDSVMFARPDPELYSTYFFAFDNRQDTLALPLSLVAGSAIQNPSCSPFYDHSPDAMEYALNYHQLGQTFDHLNVYADYSRIEVDGPGILYAYNSRSGIVRGASYDPWHDTAAGWDLLPR